MHTVPAGKYRRYSGEAWWKTLFDIKTTALNIRDMVRFAAGFLKSVWLLLRIRPDRVFIKGGYVGLPVGLAAWALRIPFIIHESDKVPGLTNRVLRRFTPYRVSGFETPGFVPLGNPVREDILRPVSLNRDHFGISSGKPVVLVFGGSQGSYAINRVVEEMAAMYDDMEIIHVHGRSGTGQAESFAHYHPREFLTEDMPHAMQLADAVVARAGANTLAELAVLSKPSVIVPHPNLSSDHQTENAVSWRDSIVMVPQSELTAPALHNQLETIIHDRETRQELIPAIAERANSHAAADIAEYVINPREAS